MGEREVKSPNNTAANHPRRGESPGAYSNPSNNRTRNDGFHRAGHIGESGSQPVSAKRDSNTPVQGGARSPYDPRD